MKAVQKISGLSPLESIKREMDRFFDDITPFSWRSNDENYAGTELWAPDTDMSETETEYIVTVDLPGIPKKDIQVNYQDHRLTISGERKKEEKEEKKDFVRRERYFGRFVRCFTLPAEVKDDKIKAEFKAGVLTVQVPKAEIKKPKTVLID